MAWFCQARVAFLMFSASASHYMRTWTYQMNLQSCSEIWLQQHRTISFDKHVCHIIYTCKARLDRPNDGSRSAGEGLCVLLSFLFHDTTRLNGRLFLIYLSRYFIWLHKWKGFDDICASLKHERMIDYSFQLLLILYPLRCRESERPCFHRSHGHNLVRPGHQSEVNYGYVSKICR